MAYQTMAPDLGPVVTLIEIAVMHFILPGFIAFVISEFMRKMGWIKAGDMKLPE